MADTKVSALSAVSAAAGTDTFPVVQGGNSMKETLAQIVTYLQTVGMPRVRKLGSQHSISSTTATKVTGLDMTLEAGTYVYQYNLMVRSANTSDGPQFGINFSGTAAVKTIGIRWWDATSAITAETHIMDNVGVKGFGYVSGMVHDTYSTTAANLGTTVGVAATGANIPAIIEGVLVVTASGDLQLYEGAESTNAATVEAGSSLVVIRTA